MPRQPERDNRRRPLEDVIHPSLRGSIQPNLPIALSSSEFRGYRNGQGTITLRLRSTLLIMTDAAFSVDYLHDALGTLVLPDMDPFALDDLSVSDMTPIPYDGRTMAVDLWVAVRTALDDIPPCTASLRLQVDFNIHGALLRGVVESPATVRRLYKPLRRQ